MSRNFDYPANGPLRQFYREGDFLDGQYMALPPGAPDAVDLAIVTFFGMPGWVVALLRLRDALVRPLGLRTGTAEDIRPPTREEILGLGYKGIFAIHDASPDEVILGSNDRHLDFRVSVRRDLTPGIVAISTWVHPHNLVGRTYLAAVYPFHRLIVARCLANVASLPKPSQH